MNIQLSASWTWHQCPPLWHVSLSRVCLLPREKKTCGGRRHLSVDDFARDKHASALYASPVAGSISTSTRCRDSTVTKYLSPSVLPATTCSNRALSSTTVWSLIWRQLPPCEWPYPLSGARCVCRIKTWRSCLAFWRFSASTSKGRFVLCGTRPSTSSVVADRRHQRRRRRRHPQILLPVGRL